MAKRIELARHDGVLFSDASGRYVFQYCRKFRTRTSGYDYLCMVEGPFADECVFNTPLWVGAQGRRLRTFRSTPQDMAECVPDRLVVSIRGHDATVSVPRGRNVRPFFTV